MNDLPRKKLAETIRNDRSLCSDHMSLQGILADHCRGGYKTERIVLIAAAQEGIPKDLTSTPTGVPKVLLISRLTVKLAENRGLSEDNACWAVESWALALETVTEKELEEISAPSGEPPATPTGAHPLDPFSSPALSPEDQMRSAIAEALKDREVTDLEKMGLESLRLTLGVSRDTASRIFKEVANEVGIQPEEMRPEKAGQPKARKAPSKPPEGRKKPDVKPVPAPPVEAPTPPLAYTAKRAKPKPATAPSTETAMFRANPQRTGAYPGPGVAVLHGVKWKYYVGDGKKHQETILSCKNCGRDLSAYKECPAFCPRCGKETKLVSSAYGGPGYPSEIRIGSSGVVSCEGAVYFMVRDKLSSLDAETGNMKWRFQTDYGRRHGLGDYPPSISRNTVYVTGSYHRLAGIQRPRVFTLNANNGKRVWKLSISNSPGGLSCPTCILGDTLYVGACNYAGGTHYLQLLAIDITSHRINWAYDICELNHSDDFCVCIYEDIALLQTSRGFIRAIDITSGAEIWKYDRIVTKKSFSLHQPCASNDILFTVFESDLYAMDISSGKEIWSHDTIAATSSLCVSEDTLFIGSAHKRLYAVEASTGREKWNFQTGGSIHASPCVADDIVYFGGNDHHLYALDIKKGRENWRFKAGGITSPCVSGSNLFFGSSDGYLYALN